jgi:hypothetical protein
LPAENRTVCSLVRLTGPQMPIDGLIIEGNNFEQAVKAMIAKTIPPVTIMLFLFTLQNYPCRLPSAAEFGKCDYELRK